MRTAEEPGRSTRDRILRATLELVADEGVDAVTHRAVAARAGVSPGSTTHHFRSRRDLVREAFRAYLEIAEGIIRALMRDDDPTIDPLARVERMIHRMVDREFGIGLVRAEYELLVWASRDADLAAEVRAAERRILGVVAEPLEAAGVRQPLASGRVLMNLVRGYELERLLDPDLTTDDIGARIGPVLRALPRNETDWTDVQA